ncbi:MAG: diguanylate cyclase [Frankiales bacterium]|nr:diguanylate cyclase [Frankiales bacterium]
MTSRARSPTRCWCSTATRPSCRPCGRPWSPQGYRLLCAATEAEAFELLALHVVHVVLCGERLVSLSATEFLERVKDLHPSVLRILLSSGLDAEAVRTAVNRGSMHCYWASPWDADVLRSDLRDAFRQHWLRDGQVSPVVGRPPCPRGASEVHSPPQRSARPALSPGRGAASRP